MTNKVIYKLKGHEKFPLREGWINKGLSVAKEKGTHILDDTMQVTSIIYLLIWKRFLLT